MTEKLLTPKYLTKELVAEAVELAVLSTLHTGGPLQPRLERQHYHIVVLVPAMKDDRASGYPDWPNYPLQAVLLYEYSQGDKRGWEHNYDDIARCKALQLWTGRNDGGACVVPYLLFPGDTVYWGGVKRYGIVVACSGLQPWFDRLIAGIVADTFIALALDAYENDEERKKSDFLS